MARHIALLRAVNVGGTGVLAMSDLARICRDAGFARVATHLASGNVVFDDPRDAAQVKTELETRLSAFVGKPLGVFLRSAAEMRAVLEANPFPDKPPNLSVAIFLDAPPPVDALERCSGGVDEILRLGLREIHVHYPAGIGRSKLKIPAAKLGTARNMNTIAKLVAMTREA
jgi:uncharacterized protein (DUF1697 family)